MVRCPLHPSILVLALQFIPTWATCAADPAAPGIPNFHQVDESIYRGGQPTAQGFISLDRLGVKTVIDLRPDGEHSVKAERQVMAAAGMHYVNVPMNSLATPSDEKISTVLALLKSPDAGPVFVHCRRGADRTGTVIACYRIEHDRWRNQIALKEAESYGMSWMEIGMKRYVLKFSASREH